MRRVEMTLAALALAALGACGRSDERAAPGTEGASPAVARVGDRVITLADLEGEINRQDPRMRPRYRSKELKQQLLDKMIEQEALAAEATRLHLDRHPQVAQRFAKVLADRLLRTEFSQKRVKCNPDQEVERFYAEHLEQYRSPEKRRVLHVFFQAPASAPGPRRKATQAAADLLKQLQAKPNDQHLLLELATKGSTQNGIAVSGGDIGFKTRDQLETDFCRAVADAAYSLGINREVNQIIVVPKGLYVLLLAGTQAAIDVALEKVKKTIRDTLYAQARTEAYQVFVDELKRKAGVELFSRVVERARVEVGGPTPATAGVAAAAAAAPGATQTIRVLTDRTASHLEKIFAYYEKQTGVKIATNFVEEGLLPRLESRPQEADLIVTQNADLLELAKRKHLLAPFSSQAVIEQVPPLFRDPDGNYVILSFRARALFYAKDRVAAADLAGYRDLTAPKWKGRVCIRSGFHEYNLSWWSQMAAVEGLEATELFLRGLRDNLARPPKGNDRDQVRALLEHACDVAVGNSYYMGIMLQTPEQKPWADASGVFFPDQQGRGVFVLRAGAALTTATENVPVANDLLAFLSGDFAQRYFSEALFEYPVREGVPLSPLNVALGKEQGIAGGAYKVNLVSLDETVNNREKILEILTRLNFDQK